MAEQECCDGRPPFAELHGMRAVTGGLEHLEEEPDVEEPLSAEFEHAREVLRTLNDRELDQLEVTLLTLDRVRRDVRRERAEAYHQARRAAETG